MTCNVVIWNTLGKKYNERQYSVVPKNPLDVLMTGSSNLLLLNFAVSSLDPGGTDGIQNKYFTAMGTVTTSAANAFVAFDR